MAKENWQKYKLLRLLELLQQETDEEHPLTTNTICARLTELGLPCERRTLSKDIALLNSIGYEVMCQRVGKEYGYYITDRSFSVPELKILIDAVQAASFITEKKTAELVDKLAALGGSHKADILKSNMVCFNTRKHSNESIFYNVGYLEDAIEQKKKDGMTYFVCDIKLTDVSQLRTAFAGDDFRSGIYEAVSDIAGRYSPVLAINADFCRYHREGVIIRNGEVLRRQNIKKHHLLVVDENGNLSAQTDRSGKQGLVANKLEQQNTWQTFEFGPVLVENGEAAELPLKSFYINCNDGYYEPRTAIGQRADGAVLMLVIDGRQAHSMGATYQDCMEIMLSKGAVNLIKAFDFFKINHI